MKLINPFKLIITYLDRGGEAVLKWMDKSRKQGQLNVINRDKWWKQNKIGILAARPSYNFYPAIMIPALALLWLYDYSGIHEVVYNHIPRVASRLENPTPLYLEYKSWDKIIALALVFGWCYALSAALFTLICRRVQFHLATKISFSAYCSLLVLIFFGVYWAYFLDPFYPFSEVTNYNSSFLRRSYSRRVIYIKFIQWAMIFLHCQILTILFEIFVNQIAFKKYVKKPPT